MAVREDERSASREPAWFPEYEQAARGLRNYWYPVSFSRTVRRRPRAVTLLGERIVLVREAGRVFALHDRCPHRGIRLSSGSVDFPGTITCPYHGWTYDLETGRLVAVLTDGPDSPMCGRANVATYPVAERGGLVWIYVGERIAGSVEPGGPVAEGGSAVEGGPPSHVDPASADGAVPPDPGDAGVPPVEADVPVELLAPGTAVVGKVQLRRGNWRYALEASMDEAHAKYLHRRAAWQFFRRQAAWTREVRAEPSPDGLWLQRLRGGVAWEGDYPVIGRWPRRQGWWRFVRPRSGGSVALAVRLPCISRVTQRRWPTFEIFVPVDADRHLAVLLICRTGGWLARALLHVEYWLYIRWLYHNHFNGQDQRMIQMMEVPPERLFRPDVIITRWRQWCRDNARAPGRAGPPGCPADAADAAAAAGAGDAAQASGQPASADRPEGQERPQAATGRGAKRPVEGEPA